MLREELNQFLKEIFVQLNIEANSQTASRIRAIVYDNDSSGRLQYWLDFAAGRTDRDYCHEVVNTYLEIGAYVNLVRSNDNDTWADLDKQLRDWAYKELLRRGFTPGSHTRELADNYAVAAIEDILQTEFTFDTSYFAWLRTILQRKCNQGARRSQTQKRGHGTQLISLDDVIETLEQTQVDGPAKQVEQHLDLQQAMMQLTEARKEVLFLRYQKGLSFQEIASKMERKISAIYSLHFKGLEHLSTILQGKS